MVVALVNVAVAARRRSWMGEWWRRIVRGWILVGGAWRVEQWLFVVW